ncbi:MAG: hypothetical protein WDM91_04515 [Rhizomicrobium sp.]
MKRLMGTAILIAALAGGAQAAQIDQLKAGKLQCYGPNAAKHTCIALSGYTFGGGMIMNQAQVMLSASPVVVMKTNSMVTFDGDVVCGVVAKGDIDAAAITVGGKLLEGAQADGVRANIWAALATRAGKRICTTYVPAGDAYTTQYTIDGKPDDAPPVTVTLVDPGEGYAVGP